MPTPTILLTAGDDTLPTSPLVNTAGDDIIQGGSGGTDIIDGGTGTNSLVYDGVYDATAVLPLDGVFVNLDTGRGVPEFVGGSAVYDEYLSNIQNVTGSFGTDVIIGDANDNVIGGGTGANDWIDGGAGSDTLDYSQTLTDLMGVDYLVDAVTIDLTAGTASGTTSDAGMTNPLAFAETLQNFENVIGSAGADTITGDAGDNTINAMAGNDTVTGATGGADALDGGADADTLDYSAALDAVQVDLTAGTATDTGASFTETLANFENVTGSAFADTLVGDANDNVINAMAGDDTVTGATGGSDALNGGADADTLDYAAALDAVQVNLTAGTATDTGASFTETLANFENITGSDYGDTLTGNASDNGIDAGAGDDALTGATGGTDALEGGADIDTVDYSAALAAVQVDLGGGSATNLAATFTETLSNIENVTGSALGDTISGDALDNIIDAGAGNDTLGGGTGGNDALDGGAGVDRVDYALAADAVQVDLAAGFGTDTGATFSETLANIENVTGSALDDTLAGDAADNAIDGGMGNDTVYGGSGGADVLDGGDDIDTLDYTAAVAGVAINLVTGTASDGSFTDSFANFENIIGSLNDDSFTVGASPYMLTGGDGVDTYHLTTDAAGSVISDFAAGPGGDVIDLGAIVDAQGDLGNFAGGNPFAPYGAGLINLVDNGLGGTDVMLDATVLITLDGVLPGDLTADNFGGYDPLGGALPAGQTIAGDYLGNTINGTIGNDTINGWEGADTIYGGNGDDLINGMTENDSLFGGLGNDTLVGGNGNDSLFGGVGNDVLRGGAGVNVLNGGLGLDTADFSDYGARVIASLATGTATGWGGDSFSMLNIENLTGSFYNDQLTGSTAANVIDGGNGNDLINGGNGDDTLWGGADNDTVNGGNNNDVIDGGAGFDVLNGDAGNDVLTGGLGNDVLNGGTGDDQLNGGAGNDTLVGGTGVRDMASYTDAAAGVTVSLALTAAQNTVGAGTDTLSGIEDLTGSALADRLTGSTLANIIAGGAGNDTIDGGVGNDTLGGGTGADSMTGGAGVDRLTGGGDADRFVYSATSQSTNAAFDTITDFSQAQGDKIDLHLVDARTTLAGVQHFGFAAGATAYSVWAVQDVINNVTHLYGDTNGNAATAEFRVDISGLHTLVAGDLVLV